LLTAENDRPARPPCLRGVMMKTPSSLEETFFRRFFAAFKAHLPRPTDRRSVGLPFATGRFQDAERTPGGLCFSSGRN
jgi:hypothetical protein